MKLSASVIGKKFPTNRKRILHGQPLYFSAMYYAYVLESKKDKKLYIGSTPNLKRRISQHLNQKVKATKGRLPLELIFYETFIEKEDALRREKYFKTNSGKRSLKLMLRTYFKRVV